MKPRTSAAPLLSVCLAAAGCGGSSEEQPFRIQPERPVSQLEVEARLASPPPKAAGARSSALVDLATLDPTLGFDIRYAGSNNFMGTPFYRQAKAYLQRPAAEALLAAHRSLRSSGFGVMVFDAYRPWYVTWMFWEATPENLRRFVADPSEGSRHNRGAAVDVTLYDLESGRPAAMGTDYDEFTERAYPDYPDLTAEERSNRDRLRAAMEAAGFTVYPYEWWHFDFRGAADYPILNLTFEELQIRESRGSSGQ